MVICVAVVAFSLIAILGWLFTSGRTPTIDAARLAFVGGPAVLAVQHAVRLVRPAIVVDLERFTGIPIACRSTGIDLGALGRCEVRERPFVTVLHVYALRGPAKYRVLMAPSHDQLQRVLALLPDHVRVDRP